MSRFTAIKAAVNSAARYAGYEIRRVDASSTMDAALARLARSHANLRTFVDVGASDGRWSLMARRHFPAGTYLLIEALEDPHAADLRRIAEDPNIHVALAAAGDRAGTIHFDASDAFGGGASETATGEGDLVIPMTTIDDEVERRDLPGPVLIKLDTHGFEIPIISGASRTLERTDVLIVEAYNFELGPGVLTFPAMCRYLGDRGFRVLDLVDVMRRPADQALWQFDLVFARAERPEFQSNSYA